MTLEIIVAVVGVLLVWVALRDVFQTAVVPRAPFARWRVSTVVTTSLWKAWPTFASMFRDAKRREDVLASFAPANMVLLLVLWAAIVGLGFGCVLYSLHWYLRPQPVAFNDALYFAYTTMLTIGFGDIVPAAPCTRYVAIAAGASGLGMVAVVTSYLFSIFGAFANRERYVIALGARSGTPPSGAALLETHGYAKLIDGLPALFRDGQIWAAEVVQTQIAYPILSYFRSADAHQSWVGTLGILLDAATMAVTTLDDVPKGEAEIMLAIGRRAAHDLSAHHHMRGRHEPGCAKEHFDATRERLRRAGYTLRDADQSWHDYTRLRQTYGPELNGIAKYYHLANVPWSDTST